MKATTTSRTLLRLVAGLILGGAFVLPAQAGNCQNPRDHAERAACEKAKEGPQALRRYVERTRMIYGLYYHDYAPSMEARAATAPGESKVAQGSK